VVIDRYWYLLKGIDGHHRMNQRLLILLATFFIGILDVQELFSQIETIQVRRKAIRLRY
jgi:hypothetical protein